MISNDVDGAPPPAMTVTTARRVSSFGAWYYTKWRKFRPFRHPRESGAQRWVPAFAGMTALSRYLSNEFGTFAAWYYIPTRSVSSPMLRV